MYKAIFIDWDNTIGDWSSSELAAQRDIYAKYRLCEFYPTFQEWFDAYMTHNMELWDKYGRSEVTKEFLQRDRFLYPIIQALGGSDVLARSPRFIQLADDMGEDFLRLTNKYFQLLPEAKEVVEQLAKSYPLTVLSNGFSSVQYYKISHSGLDKVFRHVILSEEVGCQKPNPIIFEKALRINNADRQQRGEAPLTKEDVLMIGDGYGSDIQGAIQAGIDQVWLCPDDDAMTDDLRPATYKVRTLKEVLDIVLLF